MKHIKIYAIAIILSLVLTTPAFAWNEPEVNVIINGSRALFSDQAPYIEKGTPMIPIYMCTEPTTGLKVRCDFENPSAKKVYFDNGNAHIIASIGKKQVLVNGENKFLDNSISLINGRVSVPLSLFELMGIETTWQPKYKVAYLFSKSFSQLEKNKIIQNGNKDLNPKDADYSFSILCSPEFKQGKTILSCSLENVSKKPNYEITDVEIGYKGKCVYSNQSLSIKRGKSQMIPIEIPLSLSVGESADFALSVKVNQNYSKV